MSFPAELLQLLLDLGSLRASHVGPAEPVEPVEPVESTELPTSPPPPPQKRCGSCKKKLLLSDIPCRCGVRHCSSHRLPETHNCTYDHGKQDRKVLESQLVKCVADKLGENRM